MSTDEDGRLTISNTVVETPPYQITLRLNPINISDAGMYKCAMTVTPQNAAFIVGSVASISRTISVFGRKYTNLCLIFKIITAVSVGLPTQAVDPVSTEGTSIAGFSGYTLICNTSKEPDLLSTSTLTVQWLDQRGSRIRDGVNFTISESGPTTDIVLTSRLIFNNLYTSQAGVYTCKALLTIPGTINNHPELMQFTVHVKCELN